VWFQVLGTLVCIELLLMYFKMEAENTAVRFEAAMTVFFFLGFDKPLWTNSITAVADP
jgi:hypothetical protein